MLLVSALLVLGAVGATGSEMAPSALRLAATAAVGLFAPLFWPGIAATPSGTAARVLAWSAAAAVLAAIALGVVGHPLRSVEPILASCGMLMLILTPAHALAAVLEVQFGRRSGDAGGARELAGRTVATALALLGLLPLWLGPAGDLLSGRHAWAIDAIVGISPLTHLAVASGNDLLRNQWLYQHSNLAALQFAYPGLVELIGSYAAACAVLALSALAWQRRLARAADNTPIHATKEKTR